MPPWTMHVHIIGVSCLPTDLFSPFSLYNLSPIALREQMSSTRYLQRAFESFSFKRYPAKIRSYTSPSAPTPPTPPPTPSSTSPPPKSRHASFYSDTLPAMIPVFLLGSAVFLALQLTQLKLSHAKFIEEATDHIAQLESEIHALQQKRATELSPAASASQTSPHNSSRWRWW